MNEDYPAAARRHWEDAALLDEAQRRENADHHYGFAAECALKSALQAMGYFREDQHRRHINVLWNKMQATAFQNPFPGGQVTVTSRSGAIYRSVFHRTMLIGQPLSRAQ